MNTDATIAPAQPTDSHNYADPSGSIKNAQGNTPPIDTSNGVSGAPSGKIPAQTALIPSAPVITTIGSLNTQPSPPVNIPSTTASTPSLAGVAINSLIPSTNNNVKTDTTLDPLIKGQDAKIATDTSTVSTAKNDLDTLIAKLSGEGAAQISEEKAAGIPDLTLQNAKLIGQYNQLKTSFDAQYQNILNTPGMTREQANEQVTELRRVNDANLANIAIQQSVVQGNLTAAHTIVDHKIALEYGNLKDLITYQQNYLNSNQATLTSDQKDKLQLQITQNTRTYDEATTAAKTLETQKLETLKAMSDNGASTDAMAEVQKATTPEGVIATAGKYGISLADQLTKSSIAKNYADAQKAGVTAPDNAGESLNMGTDTKNATALEKAGITSSDIVGVQNYLSKGYSLKQIVKLTNMPMSVYTALVPYISVPKQGSAL